jgi:hypothetical protein
MDNKTSPQQSSISDVKSARFFILKSSKGNFTEVFPFFINKSLVAAIGEPKVIKKLRSGELLIETSINL